MFELHNKKLLYYSVIYIKNLLFINKIIYLLE